MGVCIRRTADYGPLKCASTVPWPADYAIKFPSEWVDAHSWNKVRQTEGMERS